MVYIIGFVILFLFLVLQTIIVKKYGIIFLINNPASLSIIFFEIIHLLMPILQWNKNYFRYSNNYDEFVYSLSMIFSFLIFIFYILIFISSFNFFSTTRKEYQNSLDLKNSKRLLKYTWIVFAIGIYFSFNNILSIASIGVDNYLRDRIGFSAGQGYKILFSHWVYVACILFFFGLMTSKLKKSFLFSFVISLIYCFLYYSLNSNRNSLFVLLISLLVFYSFFSENSFNIKKISNILKVSSFLLFLSILYFIGKFRTNTVRADYDGYGLVNSLNGAFGNHENIVWLLSNEYNLLWGKTYIASFLNIIPRALWESKPYGAGPELKNIIYPGSYVLGQEGNSSLTTGLITESLMNFGVIGSIPAVFITSVIIFIILVVLKKTRSPVGKILYVYLFMLFSTQFFYAEFLGFYTRTIFTCIPIILLLFFVKFERGKV